MDEMEQKINSILSNPQMMSQLMSMAQSLSNSGPGTEITEQQPVQTPTPQGKIQTSPGGIDLNMLQKVAGIAQRSNIDRNQQALLKALGPYLSKGRIEKLEKAMRAAKIAGLATTVLSNAGSNFKTGR